MCNKTFPNKASWKNTIRNVIKTHEDQSMTEQFTQERDYARFRIIHPSRKIATVWNIASTIDELRSAYIVSNVWARTPSNLEHSICPLCDQVTHYDCVSHYVASCQATCSLRIAFLDSVKQINGQSLYNELISDNDDESVLRKVVGMYPNTCIYCTHDFYRLCHSYVAAVCWHVGLFDRYP